MVTRRFVFTFATLAAFAAVASAQQVELLDFYLPTCGPCRAMAPTVERLEAEGVRVRRVDGSREPQLTAQMRVDSYPTFIAVADGREVGRVVGATSYEQLAQLVRSAKPRGFEQPTPGFAATSGRDNTFAAAPTAGAVPNATAAKLLSRSVRLTIVDDAGRSFGTGTVIDARSGEALIVTCAHLFRGADGRPIDPSGRMTIELFDTATGTLRVAERVDGQLISHDFDADVALVAIRPSGVVPTAPVAASPGDLRIGAVVRSVGCDLGADPTVRDSQIVDLNRYDGPANIEAAGAPIQGRSGGGLFSDTGELVGVCNFADESANEGIYAGLASIHAQLDRIGLTDLYRNPQPAVAAPVVASAPPVVPATPAAMTTPELTPIQRTPVIRGQDPMSGQGALTTAEQATLSEIVSRGERAEVVVLIRPDTAGGRTEVLTLDSASPEFVSALRRLGTTR
ncbi:Thioredoxin [Botrimarina colliarenosi]|uniref:Thioredoxin n=1 Tax=Botrimarina colliarenosi TaxID=2528001 RepID=A0A5C6AJW8_9BACT|nr:trypsin-like peptidase domain-containing protein [Botrimarina colliarenosi]TWT99929.1 Thioredoxin [Botrimarina colliarenosi]